VPTTLVEEIKFDGRKIAPGESFQPFPEEPDYVVTFLRIEGTTLHLADCCGTFTKEV
jgi:hypothetical protein